MSDQLPVDTVENVDTSIITPVAKPADTGSQTLNGSNPPMTLPDYGSQPAGNTSAFTGIPAAQEMLHQLKDDGTLLSEISVEAPTVTSSPLAHLQPDQLISSPQGPQPSHLSPMQPHPVAAIQLASTAPESKYPSSQSIAQYYQQSSKKNHFVGGILLGLSLVGITLIGFMLYQQYFVSAAGWTETTTNSYDMLLDSLPF